MVKEKTVVKFDIKHRFTNNLIFSVETESFKVAIETSIKQKINLRYADLRSADLRSADLRSADLRSADLCYANLRYANLTSANLRYADLRYANFSYADLRSADLTYADLRYANLRYADLRSADGFTKTPIQIINTKYFITIFDKKVIWGCRTFSFDEVKTLELKDCKETWDEKEFYHNKDIVLKIIEFYRRI